MMLSEILKTLPWFMLRQAQHEWHYSQLGHESPFALSLSKGEKDFLRCHQVLLLPARFQNLRHRWQMR